MATLELSEARDREPAKARPSILIAEDEPDVLAVLERFFDLEGFSTDVATTGEEAVSKVHRQEYDLVLTDYSMPGASGIEVARAIRRAGRRSPVLIITGWDHRLDPSELKRNGVVGVITKPFDLEEVLSLAAQLTAPQVAVAAAG